MENIFIEFTKVFEGVKDYNEEIWFKKSWNTFSRTLELNEEKKNQLPNFKENFKRKVFNHINEFPFTSENEIEEWYESFLNIEDHILTLGQRQKLLNILIKYFVVHEFVNGKERKKFQNSLRFLHIPIDRIVLNRFSMLFDNSEIKDGKINGTPWSKIQTYEDYIKFQNLVRYESTKVDITPIEFEMKFLWVTDKEIVRFYFQNNIQNKN
jgi:hypothetical protein